MSGDATTPAAVGPADVAATFCATVVDEWVRAGVTDAVVAPGSRSTPMALELAARGELRLHVHHDERAAGFVALGLGLQSGRPAIVLTTSGTAAAELHPAVVEAHHACVPLLACTADRPPELQGVGAPQTIDQTRLFGPAVRSFVDAGVPDAAASSGWRPLAAGVLVAAVGGGSAPPGPVQLNLPFREPLLGVAAPLPDGRPEGRPWVDARPAAPAVPPSEDLGAVAGQLAGRRGVIVAGGGIDEPDGIAQLAAALGWPVIADARSGCRTPGPTTVAHADALLRVRELVDTVDPEVVLRVGERPASRVVGEWFDARDATQVAIERWGRRLDPGGTLERLVVGEPGRTCAALAACLPSAPAAPAAWLDRWAAAERAAAGALAGVLDGRAAWDEPTVARTVVDAAPAGATLVVSSSMPIRDVDWWSAPRAGLRILANRGANGIDGVVSTALGAALAAGDGRRVVALVGDLALLHDVGILAGSVARPVDLTLVVVDNGGGGIFSFLPQARALPAARFEQLFGTPPGVDVAAVVRGFGVPVEEVGGPAELTASLGASGPGSRAVVVRTDRATAVAAHGRCHDAVAAAVRALGC